MILTVFSTSLFSTEEQSEIDVAAGFYVLFASGLLLPVILLILIWQSLGDKFSRFVKETVAETSMPGGARRSGEIE